MFSRAVVLDRRLKLWKTNPIFWFRMWASVFLSSVETATPSSVYFAGHPARLITRSTSGQLILLCQPFRPST